MIRHAKVDAHHADWLALARKCGWSAQSTAMVGHNFPDAVIARAGRTVLVEFKNGDGTADAGAGRVPSELAGGNRGHSQRSGSAGAAPGAVTQGCRAEGAS